MKAYYSNEPSKFANVGDGSSLYRWNIEEAMITIEGVEPFKNWLCDECLVWGDLTCSKVVQAVIAYTWDRDHEQKLINEYNSAVLGLIEGEEALAKIEAYTSFLQERAELKARVEADCVECGIE